MSGWNGWRAAKPRKGETCVSHNDGVDCGENAEVTLTRQADYYDGYGVRTLRQPWCWRHDPRLTFVNVYREYQAYGGPEEGGWYYSVGEPIGTIRAGNRFEARELADMMWKGLSGKPRDYNEGRIIVMVERHPGRAYPKVRPHYE